MTIKEAIETLKGTLSLLHQTNIRFDYITKYREALRIAIDAIEKEMPVEPKIKFSELYSDDDEKIMIKVRICPKCGYNVADHGSGPVCTNPSCRQAIKRGY